MSKQINEDTRTAAGLIGIDPHQFALGQVHFHALRVADPADVEREFHKSMLLSSACSVADLIDEPHEEGEGPEPEASMPDLPPPPISDAPEPAADSKGWAFVRNLIDSAMKPISSAERK